MSGERKYKEEWDDSKKEINNVIDLDEYKKSKSNNEIKFSKISENDFLLNNKENVMLLLKEYLQTIGCINIQEEELLFYSNEFDKKIILVTAKILIESEKKIDLLVTSLFKKFSLWDNGIVLEINKG